MVEEDVPTVVCFREAVGAVSNTTLSNRGQIQKIRRIARSRCCTRQKAFPQSDEDSGRKAGGWSVRLFPNDVFCGKPNAGPYRHGSPRNIHGTKQETS